MTEEEHQELMKYLEEFLSIAMSKIWSYDRFIYYPYLKLCNDTFSDLLVDEVLSGMEKNGGNYGRP